MGCSLWFCETCNNGLPGPGVDASETATQSRRVCLRLEQPDDSFQQRNQLLDALRCCLALHLHEALAPLVPLLLGRAKHCHGITNQHIKQARVNALGLDPDNNGLPGLTVDAVQVLAKLREIAAEEGQLDRVEKGLEFLIRCR